jgi:hypothetical protein
MEKKVVHEVRLSKPLMAVAIIAAFGLLAIGVKPIIEATPAFAQSNQVHKIAICDKWGNECSRFSRGGLAILNLQ